MASGSEQGAILNFFNFYKFNLYLLILDLSSVLLLVDTPDDPDLQVKQTVGF